MKSIDDFVTRTKEIFGQQLVSLLLLGSAQRHDTTPFSDIDFVLIVRRVHEKQVSKLRDYIRSMDILVDCSVIGLDEIPDDPDLFRVGTHGCYQAALVLKMADVLEGEDFFANRPEPSKEAVRRTVFEKVVEYVWWVRRMFVEANRPRTLELNYQLNSRIVKMVRDVLYLSEGWGITENPSSVVSAFADKHGGELSEAQVGLLFDLVNLDFIGLEAGDLSENYFHQRHRLVNDLYRIALRVR